MTMRANGTTTTTTKRRSTKRSGATDWSRLGRRTPAQIRKKLINSSKSLAKGCGPQANEQCAVGGQLDLEAALK